MANEKEEKGGFLYRIMIEKGIRQGAQLIISAVLSVAVVQKLESAGVQIDREKLMLFMVAGTHGAIEMARNYLKKKKGIKVL